MISNVKTRDRYPWSKQQKMQKLTVKSLISFGFLFCDNSFSFPAFALTCL